MSSQRTSLHIPAMLDMWQVVVNPYGGLRPDSIYPPVIYNRSLGTSSVLLMCNLEYDIPKIMVCKRYLVSKVSISQISGDIYIYILLNKCLFSQCPILALLEKKHPGLPSRRPWVWGTHHGFTSTSLELWVFWAQILAPHPWVSFLKNAQYHLGTWNFVCPKCWLTLQIKHLNKNHEPAPLKHISTPPKKKKKIKGWPNPQKTANHPRTKA